MTDFRQLAVRATQKLTELNPLLQFSNEDLHVTEKDHFATWSLVLYKRQPIFEVTIFVTEQVLELSSVQHPEINKTFGHELPDDYAYVELLEAHCVGICQKFKQLAVFFHLSAQCVLRKDTIIMPRVSIFISANTYEVRTGSKGTVYVTAQALLTEERLQQYHKTRVQQATSRIAALFS